MAQSDTAGLLHPRIKQDDIKNKTGTDQNNPHLMIPLPLRKSGDECHDSEDRVKCEIRWVIQLAIQDQPFAHAYDKDGDEEQEKPAPMRIEVLL
jgi:hypothetical protein